MRKKIAQYEVSKENTYNIDEKGFLIRVLQWLQRVYSKEAFNRGLLSAAGQDGNREWITCIASTSAVCWGRRVDPFTGQAIQSPVKTATEVGVRAIQDHRVIEWNTCWKCRLSEGTDDM